MDAVEEAPAPVQAPVEAVEAARAVLLPAVLPVVPVGEVAAAVAVGVRVRPATEVARPAEAREFPHPMAVADTMQVAPDLPIQLAPDQSLASRLSSCPQPR